MQSFLRPLLFPLFCFGSLATAQDYSPFPQQNHPDQVFWGVAHVHTGFSFDSGMFGI